MSPSKYTEVAIYKNGKLFKTASNDSYAQSIIDRESINYPRSKFTTRRVKGK